jgi:DNA-binding winged helix-turn-helix (wHTH) protein/Tol biopolymer transport system component
MTNQAGQFYAFGPFRLDSAKRVLLRDGKPVPLAPKAIDTLLALVENAGQLVEKAELMQRVWPDTFVEEGNLTKNVYALRQLLGNGVDGREYVETVPKRGYRFIYPVDGVASRLTVTLGDPLARPDRSGHPLWPWRRRGLSGLKRDRTLVLAVLAFVLAVAAGVAWLLKPHGHAHPQMSERQITANPPEDRLTGAAISPDGQYVAYVDQTGLYLRSIDSGETRVVSVPPALLSRIFGIRWLGESGKLVANTMGPRGIDLWVITALGEAAPHLLYPGGEKPAISPDGRQIAFVSGEFGKRETEVLVGGINGETLRVLVTVQNDQSVCSPAWSPDGRSIAYVRFWMAAPGRRSNAIEIRPAVGGTAKTVVAESSLPKSSSLYCPDGGSSLAWLPDWRLVFPLTQTSESLTTQTKSGLWAVRVRPDKNEVAGEPEQLAQMGDYAPSVMTASADGKRLVLLRDATWEDAYLARLGPEGASIQPPHRFTLDNRGSELDGWTRDSRAVLFSSGRNGKTEVFRQGLNDNIPEAVLEGDGDRSDSGGAISPDGSWMLYKEQKYSAPHGTPSPVRLMRRPIAGGPAETVLEEPAGVELNFWCPLKPGTSCILSEKEGRRRATFYLLDPIRGKGDRLATIGLVAFGSFDAAVSPDGSRLALVDPHKHHGRIEILTVKDRTWHELSTEPGWGDLQSIAWAADGKGFFVTSWLPDSFNLLHVTLAGKVQPLVRNGHRQWMVFPRPSPDGKYLAFQAQTWDTNVWLLEKF